MLARGEGTLCCVMISYFRRDGEDPTQEVEQINVHATKPTFIYPSHNKASIVVINPQLDRKSGVAATNVFHVSDLRHAPPKLKP